jgi:hypothetical protein
MNFKKYIDLYILNYLLITLYIILFVNLKFDVSDKQMFATVDSVTYWLTGHEFYNFSLKGYSEIRPFLYPLLIVTIHHLAGPYGLWILQSICWIISANLLFLSIKKVTGNKVFAFIGVAILTSNLTYIVLTLHALTETITIFLISVLIHFISFNSEKAGTLKFFHGSLLILAILAVVKPLFYLPLLFMIFVVLPLFYFKKYFSAPKKLFFLFLVVTPILFQLTLIKIKYDNFSFSKIGPNTFRWYILAQGMQQKESITWEEARAKTMTFSTSDVLNYIFENKALYFDLYIQDMQDNMKAAPCFVLFPGGFPHPQAAKYMLIVNTIYFHTHIFFSFLSLVCLFLVIKRKEITHIILLSFAMILTYYIFLTIPISLWEGDRLALVGLPLWIFLYVFVTSYFKNMLFLKAKF